MKTVWMMIALMLCCAYSVRSEGNEELLPVQAFNVDEVVKNPALLKDIYGDRSNAGTRTPPLRRHGQTTEDAVMRALRWLKTNQHGDGSWGTNRVAMTGLAVLTFLSHGEKPGESEEFGGTVQKALEYLISKQKADGRFEGADTHEYSHPIATYALCEAYGMTLNPNAKDAAEKALAIIIKGQHPTGGWDYNMNPKPKEDGTYRDDTSYMGWCAQALRSAKRNQLLVEGLDKAMKLAVKGFIANADPDGGFGYTGPGADGMTAVGAFCLQILGASNSSEAKLSFALMKDWMPSFAEKETTVKGHCTDCPQYYYYYATHCIFLAGNAPQWSKWSKAMSDMYVSEQKIQKNAYKYKGKDYDVGWWENKDRYSDRPMMDTCLVVLQLTVHYNFRSWQ